MYSLIFLVLMVLSTVVSCADDAKGQMHTVQTKHFSRFHRYAKFAAASKSYGDCPHPPNGAKIIGNINEASTDTQAMIFRDDRAKEIILAVPGTASSQDYATDGNTTQVPFYAPGVHCSRCMVHGGFLNAWNSISQQTHHIIANAHRSHKHYKIYTTGHSLGGAIAAFAFVSLRGQHIPVHAAYTYGQPRIGNPFFANHMSRFAKASRHKLGHFYRVTHAADPVPNWPPEGAYRHALTEFWESGKTVQAPSTTFRCIGEESPSCIDGQQAWADGNDHLLYSNVHITDYAQYCY